jgi:TonB family protein
MFRRGICVVIISGLMPLSAPAVAEEPLKPVQPWVVNYAVTDCTAHRAYGDEAHPNLLVIGPALWGDTYELMIAANGTGPVEAEEVDGSVDFGNGPIKAWLLHYGAKASQSYGVFKFRISGREMAQARSATVATFHVKGQDRKYSLSSVPALMDTLHNCIVDLQHYWNMVDPEQKDIAAPPIGDIREIFTASDYPAEAMSHSQEGKVQLVLLIDEQGRVAACHVLEPSGIPVFDAMGCQVIRQRARFKPALNRQGKPIRSAVVTPPIIWRLAS